MLRNFNSICSGSLAFERPRRLREGVESESLLYSSRDKSSARCNPIISIAKRALSLPPGTGEFCQSVNWKMA